MSGKWLTPDDLSADMADIRLSAPVDTDMRAALLGALLLLLDPANWEAFGNSTPDECAAVFAAVFDSLIQWDEI